MTDISCQESDESDSELVLLLEEMERREAELEEEAAEEADLTVGYNSPTNTFLSLSDIALCTHDVGGSKAEPPVRPPGCGGRAPICTALQYKYAALCHCSCIQPLPGNTGRPVRKCVNLLCTAGREESCCLFSNKQKME